MKSKSASLHWEFMLTRAMHKTPDMIEQHKLLCSVARDIEAGRLRTTHNTVLSPINAENIRAAHALIETGKSKGKIVVDNAYIETFNGSFRDECLNVHWFGSLPEAKRLIEAWRREYNVSRPRMGLGNLTPLEYRAKSETWPTPIGVGQAGS